MLDHAPQEDAVDPLLAQVLDAPEAQWSASVEALCAAHPAHAVALRRRFRSLQRFGLALPPAPPRPGGRLGPFELGRVLGAGAMGIVYRARDTRDGAEVAIKLLREECVASPAAARRLRQEGEALARLQHPNLCQLREVGEADGVPYLAMELLRGESLAACLERARLGVGGRADWRDHVLAIEKVARGLALAHAAGIVHRDVKPGNIVVRQDGEPVLFDFGLAALADASTLTRTGTALGTPAYMPPEQVRGEHEITPRADVWSLGAVLYECLTLRPPFAAAQREQMYRQILSEDPPSLRRANPQVPRAVALVVQRCLEKAPRRRYADAAALADDLEHVCSGQRVVARAPGPWRVAARLSRRHPLATVIGLAAAALLIASLRVAAVERDAARASDRALASAAEDLAQGDPVVAALLARWAFETTRGRATRSRLVATLSQLHQGDEVLTRGDTAWAQPSPDGGALLCAVRGAGLDVEPGPDPRALGGTWTRVLQRPGYTAAWAEDGRRFALGRIGAPPDVYDAATGGLVASPPRDAGKLPGVGILQHRPHLAFAPDGVLFWADTDGRVHAFSPATGRDVAWATHATSIRALFPGPRGIVTVAADGTVVRSSTSGTELVTLHRAPKPCEVGALSGDGRWLALGLDDGSVQRIPLDGQEGDVATLSAAGPRSCLAIDHDGGRILVGRLDQSLSLWLPAVSEHAEVLHRDDTVPVAAAFAPGGGSRAFAAAFFAGHLVVFGADRRVTHVLRGHHDAVRFVRFTAGGDELISAGTDHSVRRWRLHVPGFPVLRGAGGAVFAARWLRDGHHVVAAVAPGRLLLWDDQGRLCTERELEWLPRRQAAGIMRVTVSPTPTAGAAATFSIAVAGENLAARRFAWNPGAPSVLADLPPVADARHAALGLCFDPHGSLWLATQEKSLIQVTADGSVEGEPRLLLRQPWAAAHDGERLFVIDGERLTALADGADAGPGVLLPSPALAIAVLDPEHLVTGHLDGAVRILRKDGRVVHTWLLHGSRINDVDVAPDGTRIVTAGGDGLARVLTRDGESFLDLPHGGVVYSATFSPDGRSVLTAGSNRVARIWPVTDADLADLAGTLPFRELTEEERARTDGRR